MISKRAFQPVDYLKITIFGAALSFLWPSLHTLIIPIRLLEFIPEAQKNTYLGILTFTGLALAVLVQPVAGAISDRSDFPLGRRRPFILVGTLLALLFLPSIGLANSFVFLFIGYCLLQCACNIAQGPFQAFIPDLVPAHRKGIASAVKNLAEILAGITFVRIVAYFLDMYTTQGKESWMWLAIGFPAVVLLTAMVTTMITVKETPQTNVQPLSLKNRFNAYKIDAKKHKDFIWFLVSRLLILMALGTLQSFALYYLRDVVKIENPAGAAGDLIVAIGICLLITAYPAGYLSDKFGRKPIILCSGFVGIIGITTLFFAHDLTGIMLSGGLLGISAGSFLTSNWALATDIVPQGEEARYLGLTNIATAGAGALARLIGPAIDFFNARQASLGYSIMLGVCAMYMVMGSASVIMIRGKPVENT
ncbi:MAG: SLC45 family MFS transporter [Chloroflexi bacterium]|nr:SLC45 family MFS transporter [Chloroflexota bacterium]MBM4451148.1 SLC45 family MFS transporter [Chloroflexota bacterium]